MTFEFTLCSKCLDKYRTLRLKSASRYDSGPAPFYSLVWQDEHPDIVGYFNSCCIPCRESIRLLVYARTHLWRHGEIPAPLVELWNRAQGTIPDWPGFSRLSLTDSQKKHFLSCREPSAAELAHLSGKKNRIEEMLEANTRNQLELIRSRPGSDLGLSAPGKSSVIRCPKCREFVDAAATKCRFCGAELDAAAIDAAMAQRVEEKAAVTEKEVGRLRFSGLLAGAAIFIHYFVPVVQPMAVTIKWGVVLLLVACSIANRMR